MRKEERTGERHGEPSWSRGGGKAWRCCAKSRGGDVSRRSGVTRVLRSAFCAVIKEMFMLWVMLRGAQYSTVRYTLHSISASFHIPLSHLFSRSLPHVSIFPSPSLVLSRQMYFWLGVAVLHGSALQHSRGAMTSSPSPPRPAPLPQLQPQAKDTDMFACRCLCK